MSILLTSMPGKLYLQWKERISEFQSWPGILGADLAASVHILGCREAGNIREVYALVQNPWCTLRAALWDKCLKTYPWFWPLCGFQKVGREFLFSSRKEKTNWTELNHWVRNVAMSSLIKSVLLDLQIYSNFTKGIIFSFFRVSQKLYSSNQLLGTYSIWHLILIILLDKCIMSYMLWVF